MEEVLLSVIVPVYNVEAYLRENLESLVHQDADSYELIMVNDGSTDNSYSILEEYASRYPFIRLIDKENGGISSARNAGIKAATGKYLGFIDSDDFVAHNYVSSMVNKALEEDSEIVVCDLETWYGENDSRNYIMKGLNKNYPDLPEGKRIFLSPLFAWNKIYRRDFFLAQDIFYEEGTWYEDLEVTLFMAVRAKKISYIEKALIHYRQRENSVMSSRSRKCLDIFNVLRKIYDRFESYGLLNEYHDELEYLFIENLLVYGGFRLLVLDDYKDIFDHVKEFLKMFFPNYKKNPYLKDLNKKYQAFALFNNRLTLPLFRSYMMRRK